MTDISHEKQKCKFQTSHQTTRSKQRVYNAERRNHTEPKCSHLPRTHPAQVRRAHMSTSLHRVRSHLYKRAILHHSSSRDGSQKRKASVTADHSGANKHWMNQRNLMRASIRNHRVYLYIRDIINISKFNTCQKGRNCTASQQEKTSEHLTSATVETLSLFPLGHSRSRSRYFPTSHDGGIRRTCVSSHR